MRFAVSSILHGKSRVGRQLDIGDCESWSDFSARCCCNIEHFLDIYPSIPMLGALQVVTVKDSHAASPTLRIKSHTKALLSETMSERPTVGGDSPSRI